MAEHKKELELLELLAKSWNNLNVGIIESALSENIVYESQWVLTPLRGKVPLLTYLNSKFDSIRKLVLAGKMIVQAEIAFHPEVSNRPCIILTQIEEDSSRMATILIEVQNGKINRIDICFVPNPATAKLTGGTPK